MCPRKRHVPDRERSQNGRETVTLIDQRILIDAPPQIIWEFISDPYKLADWHAGYTSVSVLTTQQTGLGTRRRCANERKPPRLCVLSVARTPARRCRPRDVAAGNRQRHEHHGCAAGGDGEHVSPPWRKASNRRRRCRSEACSCSAAGESRLDDTGFPYADLCCTPMFCGSQH